MLHSKANGIARTIGSIGNSLLLHRLSSQTTAIQLGDGITYRRCEKGTSEPRPLVIITGWVGSKESQLKSYIQFYHRHGIDTISLSLTPRHVLSPEKAQDTIIDLLRIVHLQHDTVPNHSGLLFHHFSAGGFLYGQALMAFKAKSELASVRPTIRAQIFDSPPDYLNIPRGISKSVGAPRFLEMPIEIAVRGYLKLIEGSAGVLHKAASQAFHENDIPAPSLWFYSKDDPVADWKDCVIVIGKWRTKGIIVEECVWDKSPHIQHARKDPERYFSTLQVFLQKNGILHSQ